MSSHPLPPQPRPLPPGLLPRYEKICERLTEAPALAEGLRSHPALWESALRVFLISDFVFQLALRDPATFAERAALFRERPTRSSFHEAFRLTGSLDESGAMTRLRLERNFAMAHIAWRDLAGWDDLDENLECLSDLADEAICCALEFAFAELTEKHGVPRDASGRPIEPVILAMGKLGGRELNFSSDVDLIFLYTEPGTSDGRRSISAEEYFRRLGQRLIKLLDQTTEAGFVFRVDTRLRPFGKSGPLALSFSALESYLTRHGRDWERYAYVKARSVNNEQLHKALFVDVLRPFVYRRYIDFGVFDSLRHMKGLIEAEVSRQELHDNVKLGPGGIREIEFVVQAMQLVRGGQETGLQGRNLLRLLPRLADDKLLGSKAVAELEHAYRFLRRLENRLQTMEDRQIHDLPGDEVAQARLAFAMGGSWQDLLTVFNDHRGRVKQHFGALLANDHDTSDAGEHDGILSALWSGSGRDHLAALLGGEQVQHPGKVADQLIALRKSSLYDRVDEVSRQRFDRLIPKLVQNLAGKSDPGAVVARLQPLWAAVARRSAYISLLNENPAALGRLVELAERSEFLVQLLVQSPLLLDVLLDARLFEEPPTEQDLRDELAQLRERVAPDDVEALLEVMRQFQRAAVFRIAVSDLFGNLTLMKVSDRLTQTAEMLLECALEIAHGELTERHGMPMCVEDGVSRPAGFAVIGYGKLGGLELGYGSDLDLVFVHDSDGDAQETVGHKPIDNPRFFARLAQRLIHYLSIQTSSGRLYEIDTRLRPSGRSGLMVAALRAFSRYQREDAWIWEHQALLRSRAVAGSPAVCAAFEKERKAVLIDHVDRSRLREEVIRMRQRMRDELSKARPGMFDLKQSPGGLADIEFLVDYWVLANAQQCPDLVTYPDKVRQLESLERDGLIPASVAKELIGIYIKLRVRIHRLALAGRERCVGEREFSKERSRVRALWSEHLG